MSAGKDNRWVPGSVVGAVEIGLPTFLHHGLGCTLLQPFCNVLENKVASLHPFPAPVVAVIFHDLSGRELLVVMLQILSWDKTMHQVFLLCWNLVIKHGVIVEWGRSDGSSVMDSDLGWWAIHETLYNGRATVLFGNPSCGAPHADKSPGLRSP